MTDHHRVLMAFAKSNVDAEIRILRRYDNEKADFISGGLRNDQICLDRVLAYC
jgi:hypothetical protein